MSQQPDTCLRCSTRLEPMGVEKFRVGGSSGGWVALLGNWAEVDEEVIPLDVWVCPACRRVELRLPDQR